MGTEVKGIRIEAVINMDWTAGEILFYGESNDKRRSISFIM